RGREPVEGGLAAGEVGGGEPGRAQRGGWGADSGHAVWDVECKPLEADGVVAGDDVRVAPVVVHVRAVHPEAGGVDEHAGAAAAFDLTGEGGQPVLELVRGHRLGGVVPADLDVAGVAVVEHGAPAVLVDLADRGHGYCPP